MPIQMPGSNLYKQDPRFSQYQQMIQSGTSMAPVGSWQEGLARALQAGVGSYGQGKLREEYKSQEEERNRLLAEAIAAGQGEGGQDAMIQALMGSPTTQGIGSEIAMNRIMNPPQPQPGFTLGPGQQRFGPGGGQIAAVPQSQPSRSTPLTSQELSDYGLPEGTSAAWEDGKVRILRKRPEILDPDVQKARKDIAAAGKSSTTVNVGTKGIQELDKTFAKDWAEYNAGGGFADSQKQINQLSGVISDLETKNITGPIIGTTPDSVLKFTNPDAIATRDRVEEVVQRNLRSILGAQFTEKEGERLIKRAYNPNLDEAENRRRIEALLNQMTMAARAKQSAGEYFTNNGTLQGWSGKQYTVQDFFDVLEEPTQGTQAQGGMSPAAREFLKKRGY
jgi:hypothetical protein